MKQRKHVVFTLVIVMLAFIAFSVNTALAGRDIPMPDPEVHPPVCNKLDTFGPGLLALECFDSGKDIVKVDVKTNAKYELEWDGESVSLRVYPVTRDAVAYWVVYDKAGSVTSGKLP